ncbi:AraC family transcriptional regulator, partial [Pseudomonas sp. MWU13-2860]
MPASSAERSELFRADDLGALECLDAQYAERTFPPHFHEQFVVNTLTLGAQSYRHRGGLHRAGVGALVLINPGEVHTGETADARGWTYRGFYPSADFLQRLAADISGDAHARPYFRDTVVLDAPLAVGMDQLHRLLRASQDRLLRESALQRMFGAVLQRHMQVHDQAQAAAPQGVELARQMLADAINENLSLQTLAEAAQLSPWKLCRQFRQHFGLTQVAWRNQLRVNRARQLLAQG